MTYLVDAGADALGKAVVVEGGWVGLSLHAGLIDHAVELVGRHAGFDSLA
jgi:hypothetical protein